MQKKIINEALNFFYLLKESCTNYYQGQENKIEGPDYMKLLLGGVII